LPIAKDVKAQTVIEIAIENTQIFLENNSSTCSFLRMNFASRMYHAKVDKALIMSVLKNLKWRDNKLKMYKTCIIKPNHLFLFNCLIVKPLNLI
jgi:hypothetical protein